MAMITLSACLGLKQLPRFFCQAQSCHGNCDHHAAAHHSLHNIAAQCAHDLWSVESSPLAKCFWQNFLLELDSQLLIFWLASLLVFRCVPFGTVAGCHLPLMRCLLIGSQTNSQEKHCQPQIFSTSFPLVQQNQACVIL